MSHTTRHRASVIAAAYLVTSLPLEALRWIVLAVVAYASLTLLRAGLQRGAAGLER